MTTIPGEARSLKLTPRQVAVLVALRSLTPKGKPHPTADVCAAMTDSVGHGTVCTALDRLAARGFVLATRSTRTNGRRWQCGPMMDAAEDAGIL